MAKNVSEEKPEQLGEFNLVRVKELDGKLVPIVQECIKRPTDRFDLIDKMIRSLVPLAKEIPGHQGDTILMFKLLANFKEMKGYVTTNKITTIPVPVRGKDNKVTKVDMLDPAQMERLEGLDQEIFLLFHVYFLTDLFVEVHSNPDSAKSVSTIPLGILQKIIVKEIWTAINALLIKLSYQKHYQIDKKNNSNDNINKFSRDFINSFQQVVSEDMEYSWELCFPMGLSGHSMFLNFVKFDNDQLLLRIDDVGAMSQIYHGTNSGKIYPYKLGLINSNGLPSYEKYIVQLCQLKFEEVDLKDNQKVIQEAKKIYTNDIQEQKDIEEMGYSPHDPLKSGSCVVQNYFIGVQCRLEDVLNSGELKLFNWLKNTEETFVPKEQSKETLCEKAKRLRDESLRQGAPPTVRLVDALLVNNPALIGDRNNISGEFTYNDDDNDLLIESDSSKEATKLVEGLEKIGGLNKLISPHAAVPRQPQRLTGSDVSIPGKVSISNKRTGVVVKLTKPSSSVDERPAINKQHETQNLTVSPEFLRAANEVFTEQRNYVFRLERSSEKSIKITLIKSKDRDRKIGEALGNLISCLKNNLINKVDCDFSRDEEVDEFTITCHDIKETDNVCDLLCQVGRVPAEQVSKFGAFFKSKPDLPVPEGVSKDTDDKMQSGCTFQ